MRIEHKPDMAALGREWRTARIVAGLGVLLLVVIGAVATEALFVPPPRPPAATTASLPPALPNAAALAQARRREDIALCDAALAAVQGLGIVPAFAVRDGDRTAPGGAQGRYVCAAKTDAARYAITFDLACTRLGAPDCIVPDTVALDGTVVYRRK